MYFFVPCTLYTAISLGNSLNQMYSQLLVTYCWKFTSPTQLSSARFCPRRPSVVLTGFSRKRLDGSLQKLQKAPVHDISIYFCHIFFFFYCCFFFINFLFSDTVAYGRKGLVRMKLQKATPIYTMHLF